MSYAIHVLIYFEIYVIVALGLNLVVGYCGMLTLAHAAYFAVGGYTYALLAVVQHWSFLPAIGLVVLVSSILSLAVSLPGWRLKGDFYVMASLAVQVLFFTLFRSWFNPAVPLGSIRNLTNGPFGISAIPRPEILGTRLDALPAFLLLSTFVVLLCTVVVARLTSSPWGRVLLSMRDDELAARGLGKNTRLLKAQAVVISCVLVSIAGALYVSYIGYLDPSAGALDQSILMLSMVLVGGVGNLRGSIVGAAILVLLPELLRFLSLPEAQAANLRLGIYGLALILMMHLRPQGVAGEYRVT